MYVADGVLLEASRPDLLLLLLYYHPLVVFLRSLDHLPTEGVVLDD